MGAFISNRIHLNSVLYHSLGQQLLSFFLDLLTLQNLVWAFLQVERHLCRFIAGDETRSGYVWHVQGIQPNIPAHTKWGHCLYNSMVRACTSRYVLGQNCIEQTPLNKQWLHCRKWQFVIQMRQKLLQRWYQLRITLQDNKKQKNKNLGKII